MSPDLQSEYDKFAQIAARMQMNANEHEAELIGYRLGELLRRFEGYSEQGISLQEAREHERRRYERLHSMNELLWR